MRRTVAVDPMPLNEGVLLPSSKIAMLALRTALMMTLGIVSSSLDSSTPATISFTAIVEAVFPPGPPPIPSHTVTRKPRFVFAAP